MSIEAPSFFLNKLVQIADQTEAVYVPPKPEDSAIWRLRVERLRAELRPLTGLDLRIVPDIMSVELPMFQDLDAATLVKIHENEESFMEWRQVLGQVFRSATASPSDPDFPKELGEIVKEALEPRIADVRRTVKRSSILRSGRDVAVAELSVAAVGTLATGGSPVVLGMSGVVAAILGILQRPKLEGANLVIGSLISRH